MLVHNPFIKKMQLATMNEAAATYKGIFLKSFWYWCLCLLGILSYYYLPINSISIPVFVIGIVLAIICPIIVYFIPNSAFVGGSLYSTIQGYLIALFVGTYMVDYEIYVWLAVGITALISFVLFILYMKRIIRVNQKIRAIVLSIFIVSSLLSLIVYASSFYTNAITNLFYTDGILSIIIVVSMLIIAIINLVFEFDYAVQIVSKRVCKKYEWIAGYGLFMSIIFIFMRVLEVFEKLGRDK